MSDVTGDPTRRTGVAAEAPITAGVGSALPSANPARSGSTSPDRPVTARTALFLIAAGCVIGGVTLFAGLWDALRVFPAESALAAVLCAATLLFGYWLLRRIRPVRAPGTRASVVAVAWGLAGAASLALLANNALGGIWAKTLGFDFAEAWSPPLSAPLNEEVCKLVGIVLVAVAFPRTVRGPVDGFVIGALVGLGFQVLENFSFALIAVLETGAVNGTAAVVQSSIVRVLITGLGTHWAMSALTGAAVGIVAAAAWRPDARRVAAALLLVLLAMGMHWLFDAPVLMGDAGLLIRVLGDFAIAMAVYFVIRRARRRRVVAALAEEGAALGMDRTQARALARRGGRRKALRATTGADRARAAQRQEHLVDVAEDRAAAWAG